MIAKTAADLWPGEMFASFAGLYRQVPSNFANVKKVLAF